ncbi:MAG: [protein-PII] uridylyltransferase [Alphaproteobacteria bacterium]|nr:[protein-PII] uridylyltransferase [Alphaproteobacteria bacterium]
MQSKTQTKGANAKSARPMRETMRGTVPESVPESMHETVRAPMRETVSYTPNRAAFDEAGLRAALAEISQAYKGDDIKLRQQAIALLKDRLQAAHKTAYAELKAGRLKGTQCAEQLSQFMDNLIRAYADFIRNDLMQTRTLTEQENIAIIAVGGYGRGRLAPYSDIDLLFILPYKRTAWAESFSEYMLYMLWDLGLKVGHATRNIAECMAQAKADMTIRTSLLEARFLWGEQDLFQTFRNQYQKQIKRNTKRAFVVAKLEERDIRHRRSGESRYLVEPNIKEGKGGLRDLNTLSWIAKYCYGIEHIAELVDKGVLSRDELHLFKRCNNFLWMVRCHLHFLTGRAEECLSFDVQTALAKEIGVQPSKGLNHVERFMRQYFLIAKTVGDLTRIFCAMLEEEQTKPRKLRRLPALFRRQKQVLGFTISGQRLKMVRADIFRRNPINLIRMFKLANEHKLLIHPDTLREVTRSLDLIDAKLRANKEANDLFMDILTSRNHPERILRRMNEAGVLGRFLPDFGRIVALMQFNMYHHYTADEHLLRAIGVLSALERGQLKDEHPLARELMLKNINRKVIYLSVLLHDIAKGRAEDHSIAGARIAKRLGKRFGLNAAEIELTQWLVLHHLIMSDTAQRRDLSDPQTIRDFVARVQTLERLRHLFVLTVVDICAVGPGVWTGWKAQLLRELYFESEAQLMGSASHINRVERVKEAKEKFLQACQKHMPERSLAAHKKYMKSHYDAYWLSSDIETQLHQARLLKQMKKAKMLIDIESDKFNAITLLHFICYDHPGVFSRLTGACAVAGLDIVDARTLTTRDGIALFLLRLQDPKAQNILDATRIARLKDIIHSVMAGEILPSDRMGDTHHITARTSRVTIFKSPPTIIIDNEASQHATIIEASGLDRPGLLHALTRSLFSLNVTIVSARVATFGERAVDVFYVQDLTGAKLTRKSKLTAIYETLKSVLNNPSLAVQATPHKAVAHKATPYKAKVNKTTAHKATVNKTKPDKTAPRETKSRKKRANGSARTRLSTKKLADKTAPRNARDARDARKHTGNKRASNKRADNKRTDNKRVGRGRVP